MSASQLSAVLPILGDVNQSLENQARSVLNLLLDDLPDIEKKKETGRDAQRCPNCDAPAKSLTGPYCSEACRDQAAFVRQFRAALATGTILTPEKQVVFGERLWWLLGGGLPLRESRIPESAKRQVAKRSGGYCESCGAVMTAVENFGSGCNRPLHLRAVCSRCSQTKVFGDLEYCQSSRVLGLLRELSSRIQAATATHECDDPEAWNWRQFLARRRDAAQ